MGIRLLNFDSVMAELHKEADTIATSYVNDLDILGQKSIKFIRNRSGDESWFDQSGNLRSSIGYVIVHDGTIIGSGGFQKVNGPNRGETTTEGSKEGRNFAESLAAKYPSGYALIVVAGMEYASYVEAMENKDVLASGEIFLRKEVDALTRNYQTRYGRR